MTNIVNLYKKHINKDPTGLELHEFMSTFQLNEIQIKEIDPVLENLRKVKLMNRKIAAEKYIFNNSKL